MKSISKTLLLSAVGLSVCGGSLAYASFGTASSVPKSNVSFLSKSYLQKAYLKELSNIDVALFSEAKSYPITKHAAVCFVTDTGECSGNEFGNADSPGGGGGNPGGPDDHGTPEELCKEAGYSNIPCAEGTFPDEYCPYDNSYHGPCSCSDEYVACELPQVGVGPSCNGKYKECCTPLEDETDCPNGTTTADDGCGGTRTVCAGCTPLEDQTNCPYGTIPADDGCGGTREVCSDCKPLPSDSNCPYGTIPADDGCGGTRDICNDCKNRCTLSSCPSGASCDYESCSQKYCFLGCYDGYEQDGTICRPCSSDYQYDCDLTYQEGVGTACNNKYKQCRCEGDLPMVNGRCPCPCEIGDIFYSDGTCDRYYLTGKTPIGVVVRVLDGEREIMALNDVPCVNTGYDHCYWGPFVDEEVPGISDDKFASCQNTQAMVAASGSGTLKKYPAAWTAYDYAPQGALGTKGKWCLPAQGVWESVSDHSYSIVEGFIRAKGKKFFTGVAGLYWSSTQVAQTASAMGYTQKDGNKVKAFLTTEVGAIRPILLVKYQY